MNSSSTIEENELVRLLQQKDTSALAYLYDHYAAALFGVVSRIVKNNNVAEEVLQDAFIRIWDRIDRYDSSKGRLFTWMLNVSRNLAIDRTRSKEISQSNKTGDIDLYVHKIEPEEQKTDAIGLREVMDKLSDDHRFVVEYLYLKGYTQSELADEFNMPLGTVKTRLRMAMIHLRTLLKIN